MKLSLKILWVIICFNCLDSHLNGQVVIQPTKDVLSNIVATLLPKNRELFNNRPLYLWDATITSKVDKERLFEIHKDACIALINDEPRHGVRDPVTIVAFSTTREGFSGKVTREWPLFTVTIVVKTSSGALLKGTGHAAGPNYYGLVINRDTNKDAVESANKGYLGTVLLALLDIEKNSE